MPSNTFTSVLKVHFSFNILPNYDFSDLMGEVCDSPIQREVRYDRQLRLWGEHGQSALEKAEILVCGVNTTTCELTKNLILPGVGRVILADADTVTETDLLSNFFYLSGEFRKSHSRSTLEPYNVL